MSEMQRVSSHITIKQQNRTRKQKKTTTTNKNIFGQANRKLKHPEILPAS